MADARNLEREIEELRQLARELSARIERVEQALRSQSSSVQQNNATSPSITPPPPPPRSEPQPPPYIPPKPLERTPIPQADLESRIGSHWLNRIGIAAVLIGVSYFLKYAFENNWIGPAGRVLIGLAAGIAVFVWSERFRHRGYQVFSYSLKALGIGVLYLSLWAAFQVYSLIPGSAAFLAMLLVTVGTAALALRQDAQIIALFALLGGFATPLLLSTGRDRELELFSYLAVLDLATLVLITVKPWRRVLVLAFLGTLFEYIEWYEAFYDRGHFPLTLGFATFFFAIFAVAPLIARLPDQPQPKPFWAIPHVLAFVNAVAYFAQSSVMVEDLADRASAWIAVGLAGVYIFLSRQIRPAQRQTRTGESLRLLHLAIAIGFITIAIPIRLESHWITVGWLVESAALLWVADRINSDFLSIFALGALSLAVVRLLFIDNFYSTRLLFNARMAVHALAIAVLALVAWKGYQRREDDDARIVASACIVALNLLAVIALSREVSDWYRHSMAALAPGQWIPGSWSHTRNLQIARDFSYSALWMCYGALLMFVGFWKRSAFVRWQSLVLIAITIFKVFMYDVAQLDRGYRIVSFVILGILLLVISFAYQRDWLKLSRA
jgi:uncharacterized membrane protein